MAALYFDAASQDGPHTVDFGHFWPIGTQKLTPRTSACALWARKCCGQWVNSLLNTHISQSNHLAARDFIAFPPNARNPLKVAPGPKISEMYNTYRPAGASGVAGHQPQASISLPAPPERQPAQILPQSAAPPPVWPGLRLSAAAPPCRCVHAI